MLRGETINDKINLENLNWINSVYDNPNETINNMTISNCYNG